MSLGFTYQFAPAIKEKCNDDKQLPWKNITVFAGVLRKIGNKLRDIEHFDEALDELFDILITLKDDDAFNKWEWMTPQNTITVRDKVFVHIQTIGHIFLQNEKQNATKSLKTDITNYQNFFENVSDLLSSNSLDLFTGKQIKIINKLKNSVINYKDQYQLSIVEKQHNLLQQFKDENKENDNDVNDEMDILQKLKLKLTKTRIDRCEMVLKHRTDRIILVLDQCYDVRNQCAMLRTAELFGIQNIWIVKPINYKNMKVYDSISRHSQLWLTLRYFNTSLECITTLKQEEKHRKIWLMDIGKDALELSYKTIDEYRNKIRQFPEYLAIVMGKEAEGPSKEFENECDQKVYIPQYGFCESFNVSVACSMGLQSIFAMDPNIRGKMDEYQRNKLRYLWYYQLVNDKELKEELKKLIHLETNDDFHPMYNEDIDESLNNDFRRNEFKHWDCNKVNSKLRHKINEQQKQNFISSMTI